MRMHELNHVLKNFILLFLIFCHGRFNSSTFWVTPFLYILHEVQSIWSKVLGRTFRVGFKSGSWQQYLAGLNAINEVLWISFRFKTLVPTGLKHIKDYAVLLVVVTTSKFQTFHYPTCVEVWSSFLATKTVWLMWSDPIHWA